MQSDKNPKKMKHNLLFPFLLLLITTACNRSNNTNTTTAETVIETPNKDSLLLQSIRNTECGFKEEELLRTTSVDIILKGKIDNNYAIEMSLYYDISKKDEKNIVSVFGNYKYENHSKGISLKGNLNLNSQEVILVVEKNGKKDEIFQGKYTNNFETFSGNWEKLSKDKKMPFVLQKTSSKGADVSLWMQYVFALKLNQVLQNKNATDGELRADSVGIDKKGIYIKNFNGNVLYLSATSLVADVSYSDEQNHIESSLEIEVWRFEDTEMFLIYVEKSNIGKEITINEDGEEEDAYGYSGGSFELWSYNNGVFNDILVSGNDDSEFEDNDDYSDAIATMDWYAVRKDGIITVFEKKTGKSWVWDVNKEKLISK